MIKSDTVMKKLEERHKPEEATERSVSELNALLCCDIKSVDDEPPVDIAICSVCGWQGVTSECDIEQDGTWEEGYYDVHLCPKCEDGGCVVTASRAVAVIANSVNDNLR